MELWIGVAVIVVALALGAVALTRRRWGSWSHLDDAFDDPSRQHDVGRAHPRDEV